MKRLHRFGFTAIELHIGYIENHKNEIHILEDELGSLACHLPWRDEYGVLTDNPGHDARVLEKLKGPFDLAASIGCRTFTYHLTNPPGQRLDQYWERSVGFAKGLGALARGFDSVVGLENCYPVVRSPYFARRFVDEVNVEQLGITLDTGHFWSAMCENEVGRYMENSLMRTEEGVRVMNEMCRGMARTANEKVFNIHIHNIRAKDWKDHQPVDKGVMRYEKFFEILKENEYDRIVTVEIGSAGGWEGFESSATYLQQFMPGAASR